MSGGMFGYVMKDKSMFAILLFNVFTILIQIVI
jgi:hypothetical protein